MAEESSVFVGIDAAESKHAIAVAEPGRQGDVRYLGEIEASPEAVRRLLARLAKKHGKLQVCYEAGPTGYGLYRQIVELGHDCSVVAPSLIPRRPGDRVKTNRRDAMQLARLLRAGELTAVWVPDEAHEAMRDLVRAREGAVDDLRRKRQAISSMLLRHGRVYPRKSTWGAWHERWLQEQAFDHPAQQVVLQELVLAARHAKERLARVEAAIEELLPRWSLAPVVEGLQALRGVRLATAATIAAEVGDLGRFESARQFMGYLGLVPGERSSGETVRRLGITKAGNGRVRRALVESARTYRHPARVGRDRLHQHRRVAPGVRDIAWRAQSRLCARYRALSARGKKLTVAVTAVAREWAGFVCDREGGEARVDARLRPRGHRAAQGWGRGNGRGTPDGRLWPAPPTAAVRSGTPRTHHRRCGIKSADQSMITDVYPPRPLPCATSSRTPMRSATARARST